MNFKDRSSRSEYWWWTLFGIIVNMVAAITDTIIGIQLIQFIAALALFLPGLAIAVRRLHDVGRSGWFLLFVLVPVLGWIILYYFLVQPSESTDPRPRPNQWGLAPLAPPA